MTESDVKYYAKQPSTVITSTLTMVEKHLGITRANWGVRLKAKIKKAPKGKAGIYYIECRIYQETIKEIEGRIADLKKALEIARKREAKKK